MFLFFHGSCRISTYYKNTTYNDFLEFGFLGSFKKAKTMSRIC